jgi:hypothetical protein
MSEQDVGVDPPEEGFGRCRKAFIEDCDLDPNSLVGSWFLALENGSVVWKGVVVGQPAPTTYLVQVDTLEQGVIDAQRLVTLDQMSNADDGYDWRFYDTEEGARDAFVAWAFRHDREVV